MTDTTTTDATTTAAAGTASTPAADATDGSTTGTDVTGTATTGTEPAPMLPPTAATMADTALVETELAQARRYMGYPALGGQDSGMQSWRFFRVYGFNEWRLRNLAPAECAQARAFIAQCQMLEGAIMAATANLDTDRAAVWTRNRSEVTDRFTLYTRWRVQLCNFLGVPPGPGLRGMGEIII
ncbi:hypothetical protein CFR78_10415 [Komagataeibacter rhaeticus]|uniref:hypothetical protein n=1 Tax=Komagataeibacter rhaeticus TaxID=215221 RepID=UPI0004DB1466|nr:hypothetical protein [Komagataeibacter rhaeticus]KDU95895.1 hypothetical protein GLUCORHAEAF1_05570 [Komagataeibacter rhaeticus AF1]PYD53179.1 hypothetical protein CFR78_10415 [Komagataeibacter rhaeticus]GBQ15334.1 hypothetical protein AA16663_2059 [Komagataeibacter rhaeticus DSM 16663]